MSAVAASPLLGALSWALVHSLWQGAVVALALEAVLALVPARIGASGARYCVAAAALGACALLAIATTGWLLAQRTGGGGAAAGALSGMSAALGVAGSTVAPLPLASRACTLLTAALPWLLLAWAAAAALALLRLALGGAWSRRLVAEAAPAPADVRARCRELAARLGVRREVRVALSRRVASPAVIGGFRPTILLPSSTLSTLALAELDATLVHELTHVARLDDLGALLQGILDALLVLNPGARHVSRRLRAEREHRCDDAVVRASGRVRCAQTLARLEDLRGPAPTWPRRAVGLGVAGEPLVRRIRRLAAPPARRPAVVLAAGLLAAAVIPAGERLLAASAAALPREPLMVIRAVDDAGPFTVSLLDGRVVGATLDGRVVPAAQLRVQGDSLRFLDDRGRARLSVRVLPAGLSWRSRPAPR